MQLLRSVLFGLAAVVAVDARNCPVGDTSIVAHTGQSVGHIENHNGVDMYVTAPTDCDARPHHKTAVIFFTDVFGIQLDQDRLLADSFARAGYLTIAPDLFNGKPAPADLNAPGFDRKKFLAEHGPHVADPIIEKTFKYMRETLGIQKIAAAGYCYGGKYSIRYSGIKKGADVAFAAHPAMLEDDEVDGIKAPTSVAAAEHDELMSPERRHEITDKLSKTGQIYQVSLYSGTMHGFGVRANVSDPQQKFGKETAFLQAVRFFESWSD